MGKSKHSHFENQGDNSVTKRGKNKSGQNVHLSSARVYARPAGMMEVLSLDKGPFCATALPFHLMLPSRARDSWRESYNVLESFKQRPSHLKSFNYPVKVRFELDLVLMFPWCSSPWY